MIFFSICAVFVVLALLAIAKELNKTRATLDGIARALDNKDTNEN